MPCRLKEGGGLISAPSPYIENNTITQDQVAKYSDYCKVIIMKKLIDWILPVKTVSESNVHEHWTKWGKRHRMQKKRIKEAFLQNRPLIPLDNLLHVVLTRIAPRSLDEHDNLPMAFKYIVDALAGHIMDKPTNGTADDTKSIAWHYKQEKGQPRQYAIRIEIYQDEAMK